MIDRTLATTTLPAKNRNPIRLPLLLTTVNFTTSNARAMLFELTIGVPLWNVVRLTILSFVTSNLISLIWTTGLSVRAGQRISSGRPVQLRPRPFTKSSIVIEEDTRDGKVRVILALATVTLVAAELLMEFGTGSVSVPGSTLTYGGYHLNTTSQPIDVLSTGEGIWRMLKSSDRVTGASMRLHGLTDRMMASYSVTAEELQVLRSTIERGEGEYAILDSLDPMDKLATSRNGSLWFAGVGGAVLFRGSNFLYYDGASDFYIIDWSTKLGNLSLAPLELVMDPGFRANVPAYALGGLDLRIEALGKATLTLECETPHDYPTDWNVSCEGGVGEPVSFIRSDESYSSTREDSLIMYDLTVDFGERVQAPVSAKQFKTVRVLPSGSSRKRSVTHVYEGVGVTAVQLRTSVIFAIHSEGTDFICLAMGSSLPFWGDIACRSREWRSEQEKVSAILALQVATSSYKTAWTIHKDWMTGDPLSTHTTVHWLSENLSERRGVSMFSTETVATVDILFLIGLLLVAVVGMCGVGLLLVSARAVSPNYRGPRRVTLETSRRILAMSNASKYNCHVTPRLAPTTFVTRTGDLTCHFETTYDCANEAIGYAEVARDGLVMLGGPRRHRGPSQVGDRRTKNAS
ncbi:unnamed protein product [Chondrus crispus]|uniref:Uncharacterized protein n=1 Tax=Chondrus crispus TaxID=2769 RepID=R7QUN0_CHOCR|nr:unnamed protein product [Chondrus crispus]CDF41378.1 unnamed protein product [Chondrus crispus]|eukprot:XP_005711672.1 unnamed protein product [Chondrus crispus]